MFNNKQIKKSDFLQSVKINSEKILSAMIKSRNSQVANER